MILIGFHNFQASNQDNFLFYYRFPCSMFSCDPTPFQLQGYKDIDIFYFYRNTKTNSWRKGSGKFRAFSKVLLYEKQGAPRYRYLLRNGWHKSKSTEIKDRDFITKKECIYLQTNIERLQKCCHGIHF